MGGFKFWKRARVYRPTLLLQQLEERIVLDAAVNPAPQDNPADHAASAQDHPNSTDTAAKTVAPDAAAAGGAGGGGAGLVAQLPDSFNHVFSENLNAVLISNTLADVTAVSNAHVLVISSEVYGAAELAAAAGENVLTVMYDGSHDTPAGILTSIEAVLAGHKAGSIAFATHDLGEGQFHLVGGYTVSPSTLAGDPALQGFWTGVGGLLAQDGRIDILACDLAKTQTGSLLISQIESLCGHNVAASTDATGNPLFGGDWLLEKGNVDLVSTYFASATLQNFDGTLAGPQKLTAPDGAAGDWFGCSVAIDGNYAIVGVCNDNVGSNAEQGSAYIYQLSGETWSYQTKLTAPDGAAHDEFGTSVSIKGNYAIVGCPQSDYEHPNQGPGSAYIYELSGGTWLYKTKLTAPDGAVGDSFGFSTAIDSNFAIVGARDDFVGQPTYSLGSAYIYKLSSDTWSYQTKLTAPDGTNEAAEFGISVSIDGDYAMIGAWGDTVGSNNNQGSAYMYHFSGGAWSYQTKFIAPDGTANDYFGESVSINGNYAIVGALWDDVGSNTDQGSAYVYHLSGSTWSYQTKLTAPDGAADDEFGSSVSIKGNYAIVGAPDDALGSNIYQGSAYMYHLSGETWSYQTKLTAPGGAATDYFGWSVSLSGNYSIVGSFGGVVGTNQSQGSAYVYNLDEAQGPMNTWFHGTGTFAGLDIYNYSSGVYYTKDYATFWDHQNSGVWKYYNTTAWVPTDALGDAPYGDGSHYHVVGSWFIVPSGVGSYSGHNAYIGSGVEYYQDNAGDTPAQYWSHKDSGNSWTHWDGSAWRAVTGFGAVPQNTWFHSGYQGYDEYDANGGGDIFYTKDYATFWDHQNSGAWKYYNTPAWVPTDALGDAPYGDGYGPVGTWFHATSGTYNGYDVYIGDGQTYFSLNHSAAIPTFWQHSYTGAWFYYDGSAWNWTAGFNVEPTDVWFHGYGSDAGWEVYNMSGVEFYTHDYSHYWEHLDSSGVWLYYNPDGTQWMQVAGLARSPSSVSSYDDLGRLIEMKIYDSYGLLEADEQWDYYGNTHQVQEWKFSGYFGAVNVMYEAIVDYSQGGTIQTAPWLSKVGGLGYGETLLNWYDVEAPVGSIIRTESWDYTSYDHSFNETTSDHEVRELWNHQWVVQNCQDTAPDCTLVAGLDAVEAVTRNSWSTEEAIDLAVKDKWLSTNGMDLGDLANLYTAMGAQVHTSYTTGNTLPTLLDKVGQGEQVVVTVNLAYISAFNQSGLHTLVFHGEEIVDGVKYVDLTNGWPWHHDDRTTIWGDSPHNPYPITRIPEKEFSDAWTNRGSEIFAVWA